MAPALAISKACVAEKQSVMFTAMSKQLILIAGVVSVALGVLGFLPIIPLTDTFRSVASLVVGVLVLWTVLDQSSTRTA